MRSISPKATTFNFNFVQKTPIQEPITESIIYSMTRIKTRLYSFAIYPVRNSSKDRKKQNKNKCLRNYSGMISVHSLFYIPIVSESDFVLGDKCIFVRSIVEQVY